MDGVGDGVGLHPRDQVIVLFEQAGDDLARGIVGVGDEVAGFCDGDDAEQCEHLVEQGAAVAVGPHDSLVDAHGERHGEEAVGGLNEQAHGLQRVSHDVFWLGVRLGLLMQEFDRRHLAAALGRLDAVADHDAPAVDAQRLREQPQRHLGPQRGEPVELHGGAVKVIDQLVVEARVELRARARGWSRRAIRCAR